MIKVHFLGGADEVGASCLLVEMGDQRVLVDAGIRVSPKARDGLSGELLPDLSPLSDMKLDAVIITHAHADHIGAIPLVLGSMPDTPVYTTPATISLMSVMFRDALRIMDSRLEAEGELPHYDILQVQTVENACRPTDFRQEFSINGKINVTFYRAGHIPGAASVFMQSDEGSLFISGDLSFSPMRATPIAEMPPVRPDALILESTYGGRLHANRMAEEGRIVDDVGKVLENEGRVLIPAFALGRAQEVALILDNAIAKRKLAKVPVYMDGMTRSITQVFQRFPDYLSRELNKHLEDHMSLFKTDLVKYVQSVKEREAIAADTKPAIIISSSGMLTGGASPYYAQRIVREKNSAIFITGYQDEESPGKALQRLAQEEGGTIILYGKRFQVECQIATYSLSAHADENELTQYAVQLEPKQTFLVHGDEGARLRMRDQIRQRRLDVQTVILGQSVEIDGSVPVGRRRDVPEVPQFNTAPIRTIEELDKDLPLFDADGDLYIRNAKKAIRKLLTEEARLRKINFINQERQIKLSFDFPDVAAKKYQEEFDKIRLMTGWEPVLQDSVNMTALNTIAKKLVRGIIGRASIHMAERVVELKLVSTPPDWRDVQKEYQEITGFRLLVKGDRRAQPEAPSYPTSGKVIKPSNESGERMEINEAYDTIKMSLRDTSLYKAGLKSGVIVLSFLTPQVGYHMEDRLKELSERVGYPLDVHPHPNQHGLSQLIHDLTEDAGIILVTNPSIQLAQQTVIIEPYGDVADEVLDRITEQFVEQTRWELEIKRSAPDPDYKDEYL